ncbi:hypothetical protein [Clostridium akagii]|uniref:hypothetical protein n=1 Tax=Clostridium akagii TaxID=91623 RepID=UPI00047D0FA6|nr:hypothetical protein [Clostridium akagii]
MEHLSTKERLRSMNLKEKINYILYYYKFHITVIIVLLVSISFFLVNIINSKEAVLNITLIGKYVDADKQEQLKNKADDTLIKTYKKKKDITFEFLQTNDDPQDDTNSITWQKLTASIDTRQVDIVILDKKDFDTYVKQGLFMKLSTIPDFSSLHLTDSSLVNGKIKALDKTDEPYGINVENLPVLKFINFDSKNKVMCIISNSAHVSKVIDFLKWIYVSKPIY